MRFCRHFISDAADAPETDVLCSLFSAESELIPYMELCKKILRQYVYPTCTVFTVICFLFPAVFFSVQTEYKTPGATPAGLGLFLLFSFILVCANKIFRSKLSLPLRIFLHFIATILDFSVCFLLIGGYYADTDSAALLVVLAVSLLYIVIAIPCLIIRGILINREFDKKKYHKVFSKTD